MARQFWIDTDMGSDDAAALIMAFKAPDVEVLGVSAVGGNVPMAQAAKNARFVAELCGSSVPVYPGAGAPLERTLETATWYHGEDGLSGAGGEPRQPPETTDGVEALLGASRNHPDMVLVTLGPLTNIAHAIEIDPTLPDRISRCVVMGGAACTYGNVTPAAEYNIWVDPEAARVAFLSGLPIEMVGWEFCQGEYGLDGPEIERIRKMGSPLARFVLDSNRTGMESYYNQTGERLLSLPDPVAMAIAIDPSVTTETAQHYVEIETQSELTRGMTVVDMLGVADNPRNAQTWGESLEAGMNVSVTWEIDSARWKALLYRSLK